MEFDKADPLNRLMMIILEEHPEGLTETDFYDEYVSRLEEFYTVYQEKLSA